MLSSIAQGDTGHSAAKKPQPNVESEYRMSNVEPGIPNFKVLPKTTNVMSKNRTHHPTMQASKGVYQ
jgi:hypothetical protein